MSQVFRDALDACLRSVLLRCAGRLTETPVVWEVVPSSAHGRFEFGNWSRGMDSNHPIGDVFSISRVHFRLFLGAILCVIRTFFKTGVL